MEEVAPQAGSQKGGKGGEGAADWYWVRAKMAQLERAPSIKNAAVTKLESLATQKSTGVLEYGLGGNRFASADLIFGRYFSEDGGPLSMVEGSVRERDGLWVSKILGGVPAFKGAAQGADDISHPEKWVQQHSKCHQNLEAEVVYRVCVLYLGDRFFSFEH